MTSRARRIKILKCAIKALKTNGWTQGRYSAYNPYFTDKPGPMCSLGAIRHCSVPSLIPIAEYQAERTLPSTDIWEDVQACSVDVAKTIVADNYPLYHHAEVQRDSGSIIINWNDRTDRHQEEVIDVFKRTIERLKAKVDA